MIPVEFFPQRDKRQWQRKGCEHQVLQNPAAPDEVRQPCKHKARYIVRGKALCQIHAGYVCLMYCLEENNKEGLTKMTYTDYHNPLCSKTKGLPCNCGTDHNVGSVFKGPQPPNVNNVIVGTYKCTERNRTGYIMESMDVDYTTTVSDRAIDRTFFRVES